MDFTALQAHLVTEADRLVKAANAADPNAPVPSCPEWTAVGLLDHVTETYDHKIQSMRLMRSPADTDRIDRPGNPAERYAAALADLVAEFDDRGPESLSYTWYGPDQSVGFWIRRMAHETVVHRADAELAAGRPIGPIDPAFAVDGIDEMLDIMLAWGSRAYRKWAADDLAANNGLTVALETTDRAWTVQVATEGVSIIDGVSPDAHTRVQGSPGAILMWLWRRCPVDALAVEGDRERAQRLYELILTFTQ
jgi:uncharacterized protein (TIGR03083 family)